MKLIKTIVLATAFVAAVSSSQAAVHVWQDPGGWASGVFAYDTATVDKYTANELSLDAFGSFTAGEHHLSNLFDTNIRHGKWGGGVGLNYFFLRNVGIGVDANASDNRGPFIDEVLGNLIVRLPIANSGVSPYVFGGGGRGIDPRWEWLGDLGVGIEYRFNPVTGIFADGRYIWSDHSNDRLLLRAGLRLVF